MDSVGVVSGLATAGALLIAALAYKRQVNDARSAQASMVTLGISSEFADQTGDDLQPKLVVNNYSGLPVYKLGIRIWYPPDWQSERLDQVGRLGPQDDHTEVLPADYDWDEIDAQVAFADSAGRRWVRKKDGDLKMLLGEKDSTYFRRLRRWWAACRRVARRWRRLLAARLRR